MNELPESVRLDKWLWAARQFRTRSAAVEAIERGRVSVNEQAAKPARALRLGDRVTLRDELGARELQVLRLSDVRGAAPVAQQLYAETPASLAAREAARRDRPFRRDPALDAGRPSKQGRRALAQWQRWSASADDV